MVLNLNRCSGCLTCEVACKMVNGTRTGVDYTTVERVEWGQFPDAHRRYKINICSTDPDRDISMREVYGLDPTEAV